MIRRYKDQRGFTTVEVIVAAVILVIVAVALLGLYNSNFGWIVRAGFRTRAVDKAKAAIDSRISQGAASGASSLTIAFGNGAPSISIPGEFISETGTDGPGNSVSVTLDSFIPYKP
ncbi:MAG TPA: type II secretion system protein [Bacillota bacterium]|nr:type II secretion system protein [Bacillota bacterium]HOA15574.1 type II secretion system protein [Bacillota bacterium]HOG52910.1 type II secretion system protein [Bacillota bacterium]